MSKKQLFVDRNLDQSNDMGSKIFLSQVFLKISDYKTHTFKILCLQDSDRQTQFFLEFLIFSTRKFYKCANLEILPME